MTTSAKARLLNYATSLTGLSAVESTIKSKFASDAPKFSEISSYLLDLGGKRMRPMLCLMMARLFGMKEASRELVDVAAGIELIHMATLLHDDIIDQSPLRRHQASPFVKYGVGDTLLTGDFLLTRAFSLCARLDHFVILETEKACIELTEGEILEVPLHRAKHDLASSLTIARKKTAALFRLAAITAAHLATESPIAEKAAAQFGESLGIAFQVLDDILDVTSSEDLLGKKSGIDLRERKPTAVNVLWLATDSKLARTLLSEPSSADEAFVEQALVELRASSVIDQAKRVAKSHADQALTAMEELKPFVKDTEAQQAVLDFVNFTLERMG